MNRSKTARALLASYLPLVSALAALALLIYYLPSKPAGQESVGYDAGSQSRDSSGDNPPEESRPTLAPTPNASPDGRSTQQSVRATPMATKVPSGLSTRTGNPWPRGQDCSRQKIVAIPTCRPTPAWSGDNEGATYRNVTRSALRIVVYEPASDTQVGSELNAAGAASESTNRAALAAYQTYFNRVFETYGRKVQVLYQAGPGGQAPAQQIADAKYVVNTLHASIVVSSAASGYFHNEVARLGVPALSGGLGFPASYYQQRAPYLFSMLPDMDYSLDVFADYYCKRLAGRPAAYAGGALRGKTRKLGIIWPSDNSVLINVGPVLQRKLEATCGVKVTKIVSYTGNISTATGQATNIIAQMRAAGVTSITIPADPISPIFFTNVAALQGYVPEWISNGILLTDVPAFIRLYNQTEMAHYFGITVQPRYSPLAQSEGWKAYFAGNPHGSASVAKSSANVYAAMLAEVYAGIEGAGPRFTAAAFATALRDLPALGGRTPSEVRLSFGTNGPSPWTGIDDFAEFWWDEHVRGPDCKVGWTFYTHNGHRYQAGQWPRGAPKLFASDGSPLPGKDPNAC